MRAKVTRKWGIPIREKRSHNAKIVDKLAYGTEFEAVEEYDGWLHIDGKGWCDARHTELVSSTSWNDLTDKPFGDGKTVIEWDGNTEGLVQFPAGPLYKVSDYVPSYEEVLGGVLKIFEDGEVFERAITDEDLREEGSGWAFFTSTMIACAIPEDFETDNGLFKAGVYFRGNDRMYIKSLEYGGLKMIDSMYIPWLVVEDHGDTYSVNMTYDEAVSLWERGSLMGGYLRDAEGQKMFTHIGYTSVNNYFTLTYQDGELMFDHQGVRIAEPM